MQVTVLDREVAGLHAEVLLARRAWAALELESPANSDRHGGSQCLSAHSEKCPDISEESYCPRLCGVCQLANR